MNYPANLVIFLVWGRLSVTRLLLTPLSLQTGFVTKR